MTLQASGNPISFSDIQTEFGGVNPISLSEYYAGQGYVPNGTGTIAILPNPISLSMFYGTSKLILAFNSAANFVLSDTPSNGGGGCQISFRRDGGITLYGNDDVGNPTVSGPTAYTSPLSESANSLFEFRIAATVNAIGSAANNLSIIRYVASTFTETIFSGGGPFTGSGTAYGTPWFDLTFSTSGAVYNDMISIRLSCSTSGNASASGTLYIRKKSTLETISRSFYLEALGGG